MIRLTGIGLALSVDVWNAVLSRDCTAAYTDASLTDEERVEDLLVRMTLDEKIAQMRIFHANKGIKFSDRRSDGSCRTMSGTVVCKMASLASRTPENT